MIHKSVGGDDFTSDSFIPHSFHKSTNNQSSILHNQNASYMIVHIYLPLFSWYLNCAIQGDYICYLKCYVAYNNVSHTKSIPYQMQLYHKIHPKVIYYYCTVFLCVCQWPPRRKLDQCQIPTPYQHRLDWPKLRTPRPAPLLILGMAYGPLPCHALHRYTKWCIYCHLLFGIMECYIYLLYISIFLSNIGHTGCLVIIEFQLLYLVRNYIDSNTIQHCVTPNNDDTKYYIQCT